MVLFYCMFGYVIYSLRWKSFRVIKSKLRCNIMNFLVIGSDTNWGARSASVTTMRNYMRWEHLDTHVNDNTISKKRTRIRNRTCSVDGDYRPKKYQCSWVCDGFIVLYYLTNTDRHATHLQNTINVNTNTHSRLCYWSGAQLRDRDSHSTCPLVGSTKAK